MSRELTICHLQVNLRTSYVRATYGLFALSLNSPSLKLIAKIKKFSNLNNLAKFV